MPETTIPAWAVPARAHKEKWAKMVDPDQTPPFLVWAEMVDPDQTPPFLVLEDGDTPLAVVFLLAEDREEEMAFIRNAIYGTAPTAVVLVHDTLVTFLIAGAPGPEPGELGRVAAAGGRERGEVVDAMTAVRCDRSGRAEICMMPYRMEGSHVRWIETEDHGPPIDLGGYYPEALADQMKRPSIMDEAMADPDAPPGFDGERGLRICRRTCLKVLASRGMVVMPLVPGLKDVEEPAS